MTTTLPREAAVARMAEIHQRFQALAAKHRLSRADGIEQDELGEEFDSLTDLVGSLDRAAAIAGAARGDGGTLRLERGSAQPFGDSDRPHNGQRDNAASWNAPSRAGCRPVPPRPSNG